MRIESRQKLPFPSGWGQVTAKGNEVGQDRTHARQNREYRGLDLLEDPEYKKDRCKKYRTKSNETEATACDTK